MARKKLSGGYITMNCDDEGNPDADVSVYDTEAKARKDAETNVDESGGYPIVAVAQILYYVRAVKPKPATEIVKPQR